MFAAFTIPLALLLLTTVSVTITNLLYHGLVGFEKARVEARTVWKRHFWRTFLGLLALGLICGPFRPGDATVWTVMLAGAVLIPTGLLLHGHRRHFR